MFLRFKTRWFVCIFVASALWASKPASAYEDSTTAGMSLGFQTLSFQKGYSTSPISFAASSSIGMTESWTIRDFAQYAYFAGYYPKHNLNIGAEAIYLLDILEWVPFFGAGTSLLAQFNSKEQASLNLGIHGVLGVDWLINSNWILGLDLRGGVYPAGYKTSSLGFFSSMIRFSKKWN